MVLGASVLAADFFQYMSFPFSVDAIHFDEDTNPMAVVAPPFQFSFGLSSAFFQVLFWLCVGVTVATFALVANAFRTIGEAGERTLRGRVFALTAALAWLLSTLLFIPVARTLLAGLACETDSESGERVVVEAPALACWSPPHLGMVAGAGVGLAMLVPLTLRLVVLNGDIHRMAVYFWLQWRFDTPYTGKIHALSVRSAAFSRSQTVVELAMVAFAVFFETVSQTALAAVFLAGVLFLIVANLWKPPFWRFASFFRGGRKGGGGVVDGWMDGWM